MTHHIYLGRAVVMLREEHDLTQSQLVLRTGLDKKIVYRVENGIGGLHLDTLDRIAGAFGMEAYELLRLGERLRETMDTRGEDSPELTSQLWRAA